MKSFFIKGGVAVFVFVLVVVALWYFFIQNPSFRFGTDRAAVITQVQSLSRLETASFTIDKIIEAGTEYNKLNQLLFGDKLLLVAHGEVIAGYDLSKMKPEDFSGTGRAITIKVPAPEIFTVTLDNEQTRVFDRDQGLFTKGDLNLEAEARQQAEASIRQAACEGNILDTAEKNLKVQLETIFKAAGFESVTIIPASGSSELACS